MSDFLPWGSAIMLFAAIGLNVWSARRHSLAKRDLWVAHQVLMNLSIKTLINQEMPAWVAWAEAMGTPNIEITFTQSVWEGRGEE